MTTRKQKSPVKNARHLAGYTDVLAEVVQLLEGARRAAARTVNVVMTTTYWEIGRRIVETEQRGAKRAGYGKDSAEAVVNGFDR